jgi:outer membrane immunogenic protein
VFGGQVGCNYQFASNWLVGVEGAFAGADISKSVTDPFTGGTISAKTNFLGSAVVRLGWTGWNNQSLFYVKGGMGAARNKLETSLGLTDISNDRVGWTVGAGWEYMFAPSWSVFIDYQYYGFNSGSGAGASLVTPGFPNVVDTITAGSQHINVVKGGVNWKFTGP